MLAILGPGAVGGLLAALLHRAGEDVVVVARPGSARRIVTEGVRVRSELFGDLTAMVPVTTALPAGSAVVLAVKAYGLPDVLPQLEAARPSEVLALLNGLGHAEALGEIPSAHCGSVQVEAAREDGTVVHRGRFLIVNVPSDADGRIAAALRRAGVEVRVRGAERDVLWAKFRFLAPTALLTAWADLPLGEALAHDPRVARGVVEEVAAVATADGYPTTVDELDALLRRLPATMMSSLQHDVRAGGPPSWRRSAGTCSCWGNATASRCRRSRGWWATSGAGSGRSRFGTCPTRSGTPVRGRGRPGSDRPAGDADGRRQRVGSTSR